MCDFNPAWSNPPVYTNSFGGFLIAVLEWGILMVGELIFDIFGALIVGLSCLIFAALSAPVLFLLAVFTASIPAFAVFGVLAPIAAVLIFSGALIILIFVFLLLYRTLGTQFVADTEEIEGKTPPAETPSTELGVVESEV